MADTDTVRTQLRLSADLQERVKASAEASGRSMNAEIVARLHNSFVWEDVGKEEAAFKEIVAKLQDDHEFYQRLGESLMHHLRQRAAERAEAARNLAALQKKKSR